MKNGFFLLVLILLSGWRVCAQSSEPLFRHFTPQDGLPSSQIYHILQDSNSYLWFATDHGLARYNGYEFKNFTSADGLEDNTVLKLFLDNKNRVWMQTLSGKLFYMDKNKIYPYQFNEVMVSLVKNNIPLSFCVDSTGCIWFSCSANSEYKVDAQGNVQSIIKLNRNGNYNQIFFHEVSKNIFITSANSIYSVDYPTQLHFSEMGKEFDSLKIAEIFDAQISTRRLRNSKLLVSLSANLYEFTGNKIKILDQVSSTITNIYEDKELRTWVSTYNGIYLYEKSGNYTHPKIFLKNEFITGTIEDQEGGIWVSTLNNGLFYLGNVKISSFFFNDDKLVDPTCLNVDKNYVYAGFWDGNLVRMNAEKILHTIQFPEKNYISTLFFDTASNLLFVGKNPPGYMNKDQFIPFPYSITRSLKGNYLRRKNGDLLNVTANGIYKITVDSVAIYFSVQRRSNCIFESSKGELLVGCNNGAFIIDKVRDSTILLHPGLNNIRVDDIKEIDGFLCFATRGRGLILLKENKLHFISEANGLCSNIIHHLAVSRKFIWCATYNGLSRVELSDSKNLLYKITNVGFPEGLPNNEINDIILFNDTLWVASKSAISFFDQHTNFQNSIPPVLHFNSMIVNNKDTILNENVVLPYTSNNISIGFEAISFKSGTKIIYHYKLDHESGTFESTTTNRQVEFLALKPGRYVLTILAANSSGIVGDKAIKWQFTIMEPFWLQWWFRLTVGFCLLALLYLFVRIRIIRIRKQEALKTDFNKQLVMLEMKALRAQMNPHFIFNVINSIQDYILQNDARSAQRYLTKFAKLVRSILNNSVEGEILLDDEIKANELYIELEQQRFEDKFDFILNVEEEVERNVIVIPSMIIQPFLENAIKHGIRHLKKKGRLSLTIFQDDHQLIITIEDNGVGRKAAGELSRKNEQEHISYGSIITSKRVAAYNQAHNTNIILKIIDLVDDQGEPCGTKVELLIPVKFRKSTENLNH